MAKERMAAATVDAVVKRHPSVIKEIFYGLSLGVVGACFWKMYQYDEKRKTEEFYRLYQKGEVTTLVYPGFEKVKVYPKNIAELSHSP